MAELCPRERPSPTLKRRSLKDVGVNSFQFFPPYTRLFPPTQTAYALKQSDSDWQLLTLFSETALIDESLSVLLWLSKGLIRYTYKVIISCQRRWWFPKRLATHFSPVRDHQHSLCLGSRREMLGLVRPAARD